MKSVSSPFPNQPCLVVLHCDTMKTAIQNVHSNHNQRSRENLPRALIQQTNHLLPSCSIHQHVKTKPEISIRYHCALGCYRINFFLYECHIKKHFFNYNTPRVYIGVFFPPSLCTLHSTATDYVLVRLQPESGFRAVFWVFVRKRTGVRMCRLSVDMWENQISKNVFRRSASAVPCQRKQPTHHRRIIPK